MDVLMSALSGVEKEVGADHAHGMVVVMGALSLLKSLDGEALPQIWDAIRAKPYAKTVFPPTLFYWK